jgi:sterol desaturase/sphingolipid hydroxylase (fatty acid hydroxylase superfamily)
VSNEFFKIEKRKLIGILRKHSAASRSGYAIYLIVGGAFVAGALVAYSWYLFVHHCAHHGPDKLPLPLLKHHQIHHQFATRNYGVSTTLWDHIFGTVLR